MSRPVVPTVLLLEDNPADARLIQEALREVHAHCELDVVRDLKEGAQYLERLEADPNAPLPAVALLDMKLPGGRGTELLRRIRESNVARDLPCLMLTTSEWKGDVEDAKAAGATSYYVKPRDLEGMLQFAKELEVFWLERTS